MLKNTQNMNINTKLLLGIITSFSTIFMPLAANSSPILLKPKTEQLVSVKFPQLSDEEEANHAVGGGKRGTCAGGDIPLTTIAPKNNLITTLSATPSLYWFIPETNGMKAEFVLIDSKGNDVYVKKIESLGIDSLSE